MLVEAIKEQQQQIHSKDAQIDELLQKSAALEKQLTALAAKVQQVSEQVEQSKAAPIPAANVREQGGM